MFCSAIIPTVGRSTLDRAVESVLSQDLSPEDFELLVVNDSGKPLSAADWQRSEKVQVIETKRRERSVARNTGASVARGRYLHFLDDDDWLAPGIYQRFYELSLSSNAKWLYGITQLVDRDNHPTIQLKHGLNGNCFVQAMSGEWIPLQSSLIERNTFMRLGGFRPLLSGPEDIDLLRRVCLEGDVAETLYLAAYVIRGEEGSTTDYSIHSTASRRARESILDFPDVYSRMKSSAVNSAWRGRMARVYLTSVLWNIQNRQYSRAVSRSFFSIASIISAGAGMVSNHFWHAVLTPYASITFERGFQESRKE